MAFTLFHAYHLPQLGISDVSSKDLGSGLREITATITNNRVIPTHASHDLINNITPPNRVTISGVNVQAGMTVEDADFGITTEQTHNPETLKVENITSMDEVIVRWIVRGNGDFTIRVDSNKGGTLSEEFSL